LVERVLTGPLFPHLHTFLDTMKKKFRKKVLQQKTLKNILLVLIISFFVVSSSAATTSNKLDVEPSKFGFQMFSGDEKNFNQTVSWSGAGKQAVTVTASLQTGKTNNTKGIKVKKKERELVLSQDEKKKIQWTIESNHTLKPDNFTFSTVARTDIYTKKTGGVLGL